MRAAFLLVLAGALLLLDPAAADPARAKLAILLPALAALLLALATGPRPGADRIEAALALLAGLALARAGVGPWTGRLEGLAAPLVLAGTYLVARRLLAPPEAIRALGALGLLAGLATLVEPFWISFRTATGTHPAGELVGPTANPALTAGLLVLALPASAGLGALAPIPLVAALLGTLSRAGMLGLLALAGLGAGGPATRRAVVLGVVAGLSLVALGAFLQVFDPGQLLKTRTLSARVELHRLLLPAFLAHPLVGHGPGTVGIVYGEEIRREGRPEALPDRVDHAHDPLLQLGLEGGAAGLLAGLALLAALAPRLRRSLASPARPAAEGLLAFALVEAVGTGSGSPLSLALADLALAGLEREPEPGPPGDRATVLCMGLALAALVPAGLAAARAERLRSLALAAAGRGASPPGMRLEELLESPEARLDLAGAQARAGELDLALAGWIALESAFPGCGGAEANRRALRRYRGLENPPAGPAAP